MIRGPLAGEFVGTFVMILLGDGVIAAAPFKPTGIEGVGWILHITAWALAVICGISAANFFGSADAHLNPAITAALAVKTGEFSQCAAYFLVQVGGAFVAAVTFWLFYLSHREIMHNSGAKFGAFCAAPVSRSYGANLFSEIAATFVLVSAAGTISSTRLFSAEATAGLAPHVLGYFARVLGLALGSASGYAVNPARDFGPRLAYAVLPVAAKRSSNWPYDWVPIVGPIVGAILAGGVLRFIGA